MQVTVGLGHSLTRALVATCAALALGILSPSSASADEPPTPETSEKQAPQRSTAPSPKRDVPDMDGRGSPPTTAGDVLRWVPRLLLAPFYLVTEYLFRWPASVIVPAAEKAELPRKLYDFFTFFPDHRAGIVPIGVVEFGFKPSVGVMAFWRDAGFKGNDLRAVIAVWPPDWIGGGISEQIRVDESHTAIFRISGIHRPDRVFFGEGPSSLQSSQSRFTDSRLDGNASLDWRFWRSSHVLATAGARTVALYNGTGDDPSVGQQIANGVYAAPYGFDRGYTDIYDRIELVVDTRKPASEKSKVRAPVGSGLRLEADGEQGSDVRRAPDSGWIRYGGTATGYWDVKAGRILSLTAMAEFADPLGPNPIPFTELVNLGGNHFLPGYYVGRLTDRSGAVAALDYEWPIGPYLDGHLQAALGNVFGTHLDEFRPDLLRFSGAMGISVAGIQDPPIQFLVGVATETFQQRASFDSMRVMVGVPHAF